jgi:hypothetical protein
MFECLLLIILDFLLVLFIRNNIVGNGITGLWKLPLILVLKFGRSKCTQGLTNFLRHITFAHHVARMFSFISRK